jgi:hypothetical protein
LSLTDGYEPFISGDLQHVLALLGSNYSSEELVKNIPIEERKELLYSHLDVLGMMAGKYIITGVELTHPDLRLLGTPHGSAYDTPFNVYEYRKALPRVYLAKNVESIPHSTVMELIEAGKKFLHTTYLDCEACGDMAIIPGTLKIQAMDSGYFDLLVEGKGAQWLVVSEQLLPGWKVRLDGRKVNVVRANGMYMAINVPAGSHRVTMEYEGILGEARLLKLIGLHPKYDSQ